MIMTRREVRSDSAVSPSLATRGLETARTAHFWRYRGLLRAFAESLPRTATSTPLHPASLRRQSRNPFEHSPGVYALIVVHPLRRIIIRITTGQPDNQLQPTSVANAGEGKANDSAANNAANGAAGAGTLDPKNAHLVNISPSESVAATIAAMASGTCRAHVRARGTVWRQPPGPPQL